MTPWITPKVHNRIVEIIDSVGKICLLDQEERILSEGESVNKLAYVRKGVTARTAGDPNAQSATAMAIATPGRLALGNLNFFTQRPAFGRYFALVPSEVVVADRDVVFDQIQSDSELVRIFAAQFELSSLSDRVAFISTALLDTELRLKTFTCSWAISFGELVDGPDGPWIRMPIPLTRKVRTDIIKTSMNSIDKILKEWMSHGNYYRQGDWVYVKPEVLDGIYNWMVRIDENAAPRTTGSLTELLHSIALTPVFGNSAT